MCDGVAGGARVGELRDNVEEISSGDRSNRKIAKDRVSYFPRAGAMATQAILILIDGRIHGRYAIGCVDSGNPVLRGASEGWRGESGHLIGSVAIVTVRTSRVPIAVKDETFRRVMGISSRGEGMANLRKFGENVRDAGRQIGATRMTRNTRLLIGTPKQPRGTTGVVRHVAGQAGVLCDRRIATDIGLGNGLVHGGRVDTGRPSGKKISSAGDGAIRVVAGETELAV